MKVFYNVVDPSTCREFVKYISLKKDYIRERNTNHLPWNDNDTIHYGLLNGGIKLSVDRVRYKIGQYVGLYANEPVYPNFTDFVMWTEGRSMGLHIDNALESNKNRHYSCVLYLNNEFIGGETYFDSGYKTKPETGSIVVFPSGMYHGVKKIEHGTRFTLAMWFTRYYEQMEWL